MKRRNIVFALLLTAALGLAGCSTASSNAGSGGSSANPKITIAFLMPCSTCASRFETKDKPYFIAAVHKLDPNAKVIANNAQGSASTQLTQAETALTDGASVIVVSPFTADAGASIVAKAKADKAKVVAYDGGITGAVPDAYISFQNEKAGELQGQYLLDNLKPGSTVVEINGDVTSAPGIAFKQGAHKILDPAFKSGRLKLGYESDTAGFDPATGQKEIEQALTKLNNNVQGVLVPNDGLAAPVIAALTAQHLNGKVLVTGQDATDAGLTQILEGNQSMTVYKSLHAEAEAAAKVAVYLAEGKTAAAKALLPTTTNNGTGDIPSLLLNPVTVDAKNIATTVIKDGFTTKALICTGAAAAKCNF
jgi:D-xylose transport system substrate-binding protein